MYARGQGTPLKVTLGYGSLQSHTRPTIRETEKQNLEPLTILRSTMRKGVDNCSGQERWHRCCCEVAEAVEVLSQVEEAVEGGVEVILVAED